MPNVRERLETCDDPDALATELLAIVPDLAATQDLQASVKDVAAFLAQEEERWSSCVHKLISYLSEDAQERSVVLELLDAVLLSAAQTQGQLTLRTQKTLVQFFQLAITEITKGEDARRWLKCADQVLTLIYKKREQEQAAVGKGDDGQATQWVVDVAGLLLQLRNTLAGNEAASPDLKLETFVWKVAKNLAKLATAFGSILASCTAFTNSPDEETSRFSAEDAIAAVVSSVEESMGQLLRDVSAGEALNAGVLKFFRLYWRAFHRLLVAFTGVLENELENCVLAIVNVAASLIYAIQQNKDLMVSKGGQELRNMLDQAVDLIENLAGNNVDTVNEQATERILTLLWYPSVDVIRAIGQRQSSSIRMESSIRWGHLLLLTSFVASNDSESAEDGDPNGDVKIALDISRLFSRFRECVLSDSISRCGDMMEIFMDLLLAFFGRFDNILEVQLTLLKHTLYPDWTQRTLCWEIWREFLCFCWDENIAVQALQLLLDITQWEDDESDKTFVVAHGVVSEILQLIAFVYEGLPIAVKDVCMDQVTALIDAISGEGPCHQFNMRVASQLQLLEKLADVKFLKHYDGSIKDEWISKYLPICFECCGTVLELLASESGAPHSKHESILGMIRVLDMCFLVLKGVLDDNEPRQDDVAELSIILVRMSTEALSQIAKQSARSSGSQLSDSGQQTFKGSIGTIKLKQAESRCVGRATETSLYLLSKLGTVLKANKNNQCVQAMKDLLALVETIQYFQQHDGGNITLVATARFLETVLADIQIASGDMAVVSQLIFSLFKKLFDVSYATNCQRSQLELLLSVCLNALYEFLAHSNVSETLGKLLQSLVAGNLKQLFRQSASTRKLSPDQAAKAVEVAQTSTLKWLRRNEGSCYQIFRNLFPEEPVCPDEETAVNSQDMTTALSKRPSDGDETTPQKRQKLAHFVSLCREIGTSLSSLENDAAAANLLSGSDLEEATAVLHQLLAKTVALCP